MCLKCGVILMGGVIVINVAFPQGRKKMLSMNDFMNDNKLKSWDIRDIHKGKGCKECNYLGFTITVNRDEVRDDVTYWTCFSCLPKEELNRLSKLWTGEFGTKEEQEAKKGEVTVANARKTIRDAEAEIQKELDKMPRFGVHMDADIQDVEWVRRRAQTDLAKFEQKMDERLGKIMNDYDEKIHELQVRVEALEKRVSFWKRPKYSIYDEQRHITEGENY
jgi:hypothetical protein